MDRQHSTRRHDPAGIPLPSSGDVPEVERQRYDEVDEGERRERLGRRIGAYSTLSLARRVLRASSATQLASILDQLTGPDDLAAVLRQLEDLADAAAEAGGRP